MIKAVIIDDELSNREIIRFLIEDHFPGLQLAGVGESVKTGIQCIKEHKPDLVFLDINLKDGTGFNILESLDSIDFRVIFITAYAEYAVKAIRYNAIDYIQKPIDLGEFKAAVEKAIISLSEERRIPTLTDFNLKKDKNEKKIVLKTSDSIYLVNVKNVIRCSSESSYTTFYLTNNEKIMVSKTLKDFEEILERYGFMRVHQSHLVNLNFVERFDKRDGGAVVLPDDVRIPVSHRRKQQLLEYFEGL